jgi:hypothetical protein
VFRVRQAVPGSNHWDPLSYSEIGSCTKTFNTYNASVSTASLPGAPLWVRDQFRKWVTLCTLTSAPAGKYFIQAQTTGTGSTTDTSAKNNVSVSAWKRMGIYANVPGGATPSTFHLTRVPSAAAGQILSIRLYDIGDIGSGTGTITVVPPAGAPALTGCTLQGPVSTLVGCGFNVTSSSMQGKWETIKVPIPATYSCNDADYTKCWFTLKYSFGATANPVDTTSWTAGIDGNPVRLIE